MASSDVARFMRKQYLDSLAKEENSRSSDPILAQLKKIGEELTKKSTALTRPESIPLLQDLNNALTERRILKEQNKSIKRIFPCHDRVAHMNERSVITAKRLDEIEKELDGLEEIVTQPKFLDLDGYTFYKPDRNTYIEEDVSDELEKRMVEWLSMSSVDDFKTVGICGMGGSGKAALVKNVLKQKAITDIFKCIIWASISELTSETEIKDWIIKYLLYRFGLDTDTLVDKIDEDEGWLMKELAHRLQESKNFIIVLDDLWHCSDWLAGDFLGLLKTNRGGAVIVTSRRITVVKKIIEKNKLIQFNPLELAYKGSTFLKNKDLGN